MRRSGSGTLSDIVVGGAGFAGLALAIALREGLGPAFAVTVTDPALAHSRSKDPRASAIAAAARRLFEAVGVWDAVSADAQPILDQIAADIVSRPHGGLFVRGHTDNVPIVKPETVQRFPHGNLQLSASRAVEVAAQLIQRGKVASDRVTVMGFGPSDPVAPNDSPEGRQKNRRVDIFVADE